MKGLYIHIPFCVKKCDYCDFISFSGCDKYFGEYTDALIREMDEYRGECIDTVFIGGGTPSILPKELTKKICDAVKERFKISENVEWTSEVNPGTVDMDKIVNMKECGINRVSIGIQSFNDNELLAVGRIHNAETAYKTVLDFKKAGFRNISIDLMASLPYQTKDSFLNSLKKAMELPINHISVYSLIIEENTPIKNKYDMGVYVEPDEDTDRELYKLTCEALKEKGFMRYEISNYAKKGFESKHNLKYWDCDEYIGIGLGAHSYIDGKRFSNTENLASYLKGDDIHQSGEILTREDMIGEFMMLGLRKTDGINRDEFIKRFGIELEVIYKDAIDRFVKLGLMELKENCCLLTERGLDLYNTVACEFV